MNFNVSQSTENGYGNNCLMFQQLTKQLSVHSIRVLLNFLVNPDKQKWISK